MAGHGVGEVISRSYLEVIKKLFLIQFKTCLLDKGADETVFPWPRQDQQGK